MSEEVYHIPALLSECIEALQIKENGVYVDATFGGGGHSRAILSDLGPDGALFGFDQDEDALGGAPDDPRFTMVYGNFRFLRNFLRYYGHDAVDGILADLGVSFHHFDAAERGFSFRADAPLDMRMNRHSALSAQNIINDYTEEQIADILYLYGELSQSRQMARAIVKARQEKQIATTGELLEIINPFIDKRKEKKELACVFQALRIEVNGELKALKSFLAQTAQALRKGGRLAIITYHSLEDRLVKNFLKTGNFEGRVVSDIYGRTSTPFKLNGSKPIVASEDEVERNPRSRSAKLRVATKL